MFRRLVLILLFACSPRGPAEAGTRAAYSDGWASPMEVAVDDRGDAVARYGQSRRIIVSGGETFIVEERLTGPVVIRAGDLDALLPQPRYDPSNALQRLGTHETDGRTGIGYGYPKTATRDREIILFLVVPDPAFRPLGAAMSRLLDAEALIVRWQQEVKPKFQLDPAPVRSALAKGRPLIFHGRRLQSLVEAPVAASELALPAPALSRDALAHWLGDEAEAATRPPVGDTMILRAAYAGGRLWLLSDDGGLSSIVEGGDSRVAADRAEKVVDICASRSELLALASAAGGWTVQSWRAGSWERRSHLMNRGDRPIALACQGRNRILLTSSRLIDLDRTDGGVALSGKLVDSRVRSAVHVTRGAVFVGANSGEWGGGLQRIDRRTGVIGPAEARAANDRCRAPIGGDCGAVNGIADIPWRKSCVAVAVGLIHFFSSGKLASVCPDATAILAALPVDPYETGKGAADAAKGGIRSIAFFGIVASRGRLLAAGQDGLYRIGADGKAERQSWPRFRRIGGVLVSFERPDVVLVMSGLNRRASISGIAPLMVAR